MSVFCGAQGLWIVPCMHVWAEWGVDEVWTCFDGHINRSISKNEAGLVLHSGWASLKRAAGKALCPAYWTVLGTQQNGSHRPV
jgi:hypothetical protein